MKSEAMCVCDCACCVVQSADLAGQAVGVCAYTQGCNEAGVREHNSLGANSLLWGCWITAGMPNYYRRRRKVPIMSQVLFSIQ